MADILGDKPAAPTQEVPNTIMRLGILADIHGNVENLRRAIDRLGQEQVDTFVVLGDVIYDSRNATEVVDLLRACEAVGVWGNHDLGLCVDPDSEMRALYTDAVLEFFSTLHSRFELGEILFSHTLPNQDASDPSSYYLGPRLHEDDALDQCFAQFPHRLIMIGHFHRWFAANSEGRIPWEGIKPIGLSPDTRYFFAIHAVMDGFAAVLDETQNLLLPVRF